MRGAILAGRAVVRIGTDNSSLMRGLKQMRENLRKTADFSRKAGMQIALALAVTAAPVGAGIKTFASFDDQMRVVKATSQASADEFGKLTARAKNLGATTSYTATQVASLMTELARAGFDPSQVNKMTGAVLSLAKATSTDATNASGIMAAAIRQFGLAGEDASRVADGLTAAANKTFNTVDALGEALQYAGPVAADFNVSLEDTLAVLGALGNVGIQGSAAGTALRRLFTIVGAESAKMQKIFGVQTKDAAGNARPLIDVLGDIQAATADLGTAARSEKFNEAFGLLGITAASVLSKGAGSVKGLAAEIKAAGGVADATAEEMDAGLGGSFRKLLSAVEGVSIAIGEALSPDLMRISAQFTEVAGKVLAFIERNRDMVRIASAVGVGVGVLAVGLMTLGVTAKLLGGGLGVVAFGLKSLKSMGGLAVSPLTKGFRSASAAARDAYKGTNALFAAGGKTFKSIGATAAAAAAKIRTSYSAASRFMLAAISRIAALWQTSQATMAAQSVAAGKQKQDALVRVLMIALRTANRMTAAFERMAATIARSLITHVGGAYQKLALMGRAVAQSTARDFQRATQAAIGRQPMLGMAGAGGGRGNVLTLPASAIAPARSTALAVRQAGLPAQVSSGRALVAGGATALGRPRSRVEVMGGSSTWNTPGHPQRQQRTWGAAWTKISQHAKQAMRAAFGSITGYGSAAASKIAGGFRAGMATAGASALAMTKSMGKGAGKATLGMGKGLGSAAMGMGRGLGSAASGVGMLSMVAGPALGPTGALLGMIPMVLSGVAAIGSAIASMLTPFGLVAAAVGGGIYLWSQYSEAGKEATSAVSDAVKPIAETFKSAFEGIKDAFVAGDLKLAARIGFKGVQVAALQGVSAIAKAVGGEWGDFIGALGSSLLSGDINGAWKTVVEGMVNTFGGFADGIVAGVAEAARQFVAYWKTAVNSVADYFLALSANGGWMGKLATKVLGVDMSEEQAKSEQLKRQQNEVDRKLLAQLEEQLAEVQASEGPVFTEMGTEIDPDQLRREIEAIRQRLGEPAENMLTTAQADTKRTVSRWADDATNWINEAEKSLEAELAAARDRIAQKQGGEGQAAAEAAAAKAEEELAKLRRLAAARRKAAEAKQQMEEDKQSEATDVQSGVQEGIAAAGNPSDKIAGTFSAAAFAAMGQGQSSEQRLVTAMESQLGILKARLKQAQDERQERRDQHRQLLDQFARAEVLV